MLIWQRQCRLPRLCYIYTLGMNYYIHTCTRYVNRVARNKSHRVTVRDFSATHPIRLVASCVTALRDLEYFIHTKFHQNPSSGSGEVENVNSLTDDGRTANNA